MADLLSNAEELEIRAAIQDVTDTFMKTEVKYQQAGDSLDRFNEDTKKQQKITEHTFMALAEFEAEDVEENIEGAVDRSDIMLTVNIDDLQAINLVSAPNWTVPFNETKDYFVCKGMKYKVTYVGYDGPLSNKPCLVIIKGKKDIKAT